MFKRDIIERRATKLLWVIHSLQDNFQSDDEGKSSQLTSCVVQTQDGACWVLELRALKQEQFNAKLIVHAIETPDDLKNGFQQRKLFIEPYVFKNDQTTGCGHLKDEHVAYFTQDELSFEYPNYVWSFRHQHKVNQGFSERIAFQLTLIPSRLTQDDDELIKASKRHMIKQRRYVNRHDEIPTDLLTGLVNEGTTCYLNSMLQTLFHLKCFRSMIFQMCGSDNQVIYGLQRIFYNLQTQKEAVRTAELLQAFGWSREQRNVQQDVGEFWMLLSDCLENQMKKTPLEG